MIQIQKVLVTDPGSIGRGAGAVQAVFQRPGVCLIAATQEAVCFPSRDHACFICSFRLLPEGQGQGM